MPLPRLARLAVLAAVAMLATGCEHERDRTVATPTRVPLLYSVQEVRAAFAAEGIPLAPVIRNGHAVALQPRGFAVTEDPGDPTVYVWTIRTARAGLVAIVVQQG